MEKHFTMETGELPAEERDGGMDVSFGNILRWCLLLELRERGLICEDVFRWAEKKLKERFFTDAND